MEKIGKTFSSQQSLKGFIEYLGLKKEDLMVFYDEKGHQVSFSNDEGDLIEETWHTSGFLLGDKSGFISHSIPVEKMDADAWDEAVAEDWYNISFVTEDTLREGETSLRKYWYIHKKPFGSLKLMTRRD